MTHVELDQGKGGTPKTYATGFTRVFGNRENAIHSPLPLVIYRRVPLPP